MSKNIAELDHGTERLPQYSPPNENVRSANESHFKEVGAQYLALIGDAYDGGMGAREVQKFSSRRCYRVVDFVVTRKKRLEGYIKICLTGFFYTEKIPSIRNSPKVIGSAPILSSSRLSQSGGYKVSNRHHSKRLKTIFLTPVGVIPGRLVLDEINLDVRLAASGKPQMRLDALGSAWKIQNRVEPQ
jgi:hypothetical protein